MQMSLRIPILLSQSKINHVDLIPTFSSSHQEIVRFDISVNKVSGMNVFHSGDLEDSAWIESEFWNVERGKER